MDEVERLIAEFGADDADRLHLIQEIESHGGDRAAEFLASVAEGEDEDDYVRVEALKALRLWESASREVRLAVGDRVARTLKDSKEDLVRSFAGMALSNFFDVPGVFDALRAVVSDDREDEDVRHNALDALEDHLADERVQTLMKELARVEGSIGAAAKRNVSGSA